MHVHTALEAHISQHASTQTLVLTYQACVLHYVHHHAAQSLTQHTAGVYAPPTRLTHASLGWFRRAAQFCGEAVSTLNRRLAQGPADNWFVSNM